MTSLTGTRIRLRNVQLNDWQLFATCFADSLPDGYGAYTNARALRDCDACFVGNTKVEEPLTDSSNFIQTLVIESIESNTSIGIHRARMEGKTVHVLNQALIPEWRGKGLMAELQQVLQAYAFGALGAEECYYEVQHRSIGALSHVTHREQYEHIEDKVSERTKAPLHRGRITRTAWEVVK